MIPMFEETKDGEWNYEELLQHINSAIVGVVLLREFASVPPEYKRRLHQSKKSLQNIKQLVIEIGTKTMQ